MAFGSVAASKVKIILQAEDNVTPILQQIKKNIKTADKELKTSMAKWDKAHPQAGLFSYNRRTPWSSQPMMTFENAKLLSGQGFYNPFVSGATILAASKQIEKASKQYLAAAMSAQRALKNASKHLFDVGTSLSVKGGLLTGAGIAGLRSLYKPLSDFGDFQRNMLEAQVKSGASAAQYNSMVDAARQYAANSSWDPRQVSSVMAKMASMGFTPDQLTNSFRQIMDYSRAVGQDDPMWAAQGIGAMLNSFGIDAADSGMVSKVIDKMTAAIVNSPLRDDTLREAMKQSAPLMKDKGATIDDMLAWSMAMAQKGIDGSIAGTAQKNFLTRIGKDKIAAYMKSMGVDVYDEGGNRRSARQILADISYAKKNYAGRGMTGREWDTFTDTVFGIRSQAGINAIFDEGLLERSYSALMDANDLSQQIREHMESGVFGSLKRIQSALQDMFLEIGKSLENLLKEWEPKIIAWFHWATETVGDNPRFVQWLADAYAWMVQIGIPLTAIGASIMLIGGVLSGIQTIISFLITAVTQVLYPVVMGLAKFIVGIFTTMGAIGATVFVVIAAFVVITAYTFRWGKILQAMFNGGSILHGIKLMGWSLWESLKWASSHFFRYFLLWIAKLAGVMWKIIVLPLYGVMKAASYIPGLQSVGKAADTMLNAPGQMAESGINWFFDEIDKENERTRKEYFKDLEKYSEAAKAQNTSNAKDVAKRGRKVAMPKPQNDLERQIAKDQHEAQVRADWAKYILSKDPYRIMPSVEKAEKIIQKVKDEEAKIAALYQKQAEAKAKAENADDRKAKKERKKAIAEAQAEEKRHQAEEQKAKAFKANQLKRQAELTKNLKPIFQGSMEAAKWLHGLGEYGKNEKETREEEMADNVAGIYDILSSGEGVALMGV